MNYTIIEMVRLAIEVIRKESREIVAYDKPGYAGKTMDTYTNADLAAQRHYINWIEENFPGYGMIGEENGLRVPCEIPGKNLFFIIDPLDGTKAYKRGQSHGIGTMLAMVDGNKVIAAYVGNVNTGEIMGFGPDNEMVTRIRFGNTFDLKKLKVEPIDKCYIGLDKAPWVYPAGIEKVFYPPQMGGLFQNIQIMNGSIATNMARLWNGEIGAIMLEPAVAPWDWAPVIGMSKVLGLAHLRWNDEQVKFEEYEPEVFTEVRKSLPHKTEIVTRKEYTEAILNQFN